MKDFEWRKQFAPNGYYYIRQVVPFENIDQAYFPKNILRRIIENMQQRLEDQCPYLFDPVKRETRLSIWPKDIGETINHHDPLYPRLGIEIEIRQPIL